MTISMSIHVAANDNILFFIGWVILHFVYMYQIRSDQPLSHVRLFATPWIAARQASLPITNSRSSLGLMTTGVSDAIQPSHPLSSPPPPAPNPSQHQGLSRHTQMVTRYAVLYLVSHTWQCSLENLSYCTEGFLVLLLGCTAFHGWSGRDAFNLSCAMNRLFSVFCWNKQPYFCTMCTRVGVALR